MGLMGSVGQAEVCQDSLQNSEGLVCLLACPSYARYFVYFLLELLMVPYNL